ncbi:hypothetical protein CR513_43285, partial [Mucuna pruriens]
MAGISQHRLLTEWLTFLYSDIGFRPLALDIMYILYNPPLPPPFLPSSLLAYLPFRWSVDHAMPNFK